MTKRCEDCKYSKRRISDFIFMLGSYKSALCTHPLSVKRDTPLYHLGEDDSTSKVLECNSCWTMRGYRGDGYCNPEARFFKPRERRGNA